MTNKNKNKTQMVNHYTDAQYQLNREKDTPLPWSNPQLSAEQLNGKKDILGPIRGETPRTKQRCGEGLEVLSEILIE